MKTSFRSAIVLLTAIVLTSGCAVIDSHSHTKVSGQLVSDDTLASVETGVTTETRLIAMLGDPSSVSKEDDGSRVLEYRSKRVTHKNAELLFVIDTSSTSERVKTIRFTVKDGVVVRVRQKTDSRSYDAEF